MASRGTADRNNITVMLLGKTGAGKSLLGNRLLGIAEEDKFFFDVSDSTTRGTIGVKFASKYSKNKKVTLRVFDTPGLFDDKDVVADRWLDVLKAFDLADGVIDVLLIVMTIREPSFNAGMDVMKILMEYFHRLTSYSVVVFTNCKEGSYNERDVLSKFNKHYSQGTAGISFVFSDQRGTQGAQQRALNDIIGHVKDIKTRTPLVKEDFENFFAENLAKKVKSMGISTKMITFQCLQKHSNLEIELVRRYVKEEVLRKAWRELNNIPQQTTTNQKIPVSVARIAVLVVFIAIFIAFIK